MHDISMIKLTWMKLKKWDKIVISIDIIVIYFTWSRIWTSDSGIIPSLFYTFIMKGKPVGKKKKKYLALPFSVCPVQKSLLSGDTLFSSRHKLGDEW